MMKHVMYILIAIAAIMVVSAYGYSDSRVSYTIPYNNPDPSLKTTDSFYLQKMGVIDNTERTADGRIIAGDYILPSIFQDVDENNYVGSNEAEREFNITDNKTMVSIKNAQAIDLTEMQMQRANISLGQESWL